jgi:myo-inositol-1(or 4)-monophosphatase
MARSATPQRHGQAATKAGRSLSRDFGEVQNLQVSLKGPGDYVSQADRKAEDIIFTELSKARPGYAFLMEERGEVAGDDDSASLDRRSARRHDQLPARHSDLRRSRSRLSGRARSSPASSTIRRWTSSTPPSAAAAPSSTIAACACRPHQALGCSDRHRCAASRPRPPRQLVPDRAAKCHGRSAGIRRMGSAALDLAYVAAGRIDGFWEAAFRRGTWPQACS